MADENPEDHGPIEEKQVSDIRKKPYKIPDYCKWVECDMNDKDTVIISLFSFSSFIFSMMWCEC